MATFKNGERVADDFGNTGIVEDSIEMVRVRWDLFSNIYGVYPVENFTPVTRNFKPGDYVRVVPSDSDFANEIGFVFEDDGDDEENMPYVVGFFDEEESENSFSASELIAWVPLVGDRVVASDDEDEVGTVIAVVDNAARVLWDEYPSPQNWPLDDLEPADGYEEDDVFEVGDEVEYTNPFLASPITAVVLDSRENCLGVSFHANPSMDGYYNKDFFETKAA
jgi:hypothetical protein